MQQLRTVGQQPPADEKTLEAREECLRAREARLEEMERDLRAREAALLGRDRVLIDILESTLAGYWDWNVPAGTEYMSPAFKKMLGYEYDELPNVPETWQRLIFKEDLSKVLVSFDRHIESRGREPFSNEVRYRHKDGSTVWVVCAGRVIEWTESGAPIRMVGCHVNVSDRKRAEEELKRSEYWLQSIFDSIDEAVFVVKPDRTLTHLNQAAECIFGYTASEVAEHSTEVFHVDHEHFLDFGARIQESFAKGQTARFEFECKNRDGTVFPSEHTVSLLKDTQGQPMGIVSVVRDISGRKRFEREANELREQLYHAQKLEAIATLAGGVAHDFNNILAGLLSGLSLLELELRDTDLARQTDLKDMMDLVDRGTELSKQLLGFGRRGKYDVAPRSLPRIVEGTVALFTKAHRATTVELSFSPDLKATLVDRAQIDQVFLNLFINAAHAMPSGGRITVSATNVSIDGAEAARLNVKPGDFVRVVVKDAGVGIEPTILPRIFEPFFTTKEAGVGTGLGLASVYGIIRSHGGHVTVTSKIGDGATFTILLPATEQAHIEESITAERSVRPGEGKILVVDDDAMLLRLCARVLKKLGYEVLTAPGGRAAVELVRQHRDQMTLVILDMTMPEMSGPTVFQKIREIAPELKVLLASGYAIDREARSLLEQGACGFIQKPFTIAGLSEKIQAIR
ncbi:MAG: PAS domain S-box protein [Deltaproteobacteria bacterium]|nr:PAS domain S-box protein [Deltaproteobacteria bacterium]